MQTSNTVPMQVEALVVLFNSMESNEEKKALLNYLQQLDYRETAGLCLNAQEELFFDENVYQETLYRAKSRDEAQVIMDLFVQLFKAADTLGRSVNELKSIKGAASQNADLSINAGPRGADEDYKIISNCSTCVSGLKDFYDEFTSEGGMQFGTQAHEA